MRPRRRRELVNETKKPIPFKKWVMNSSSDHMPILSTWLKGWKMLTDGLCFVWTIVICNEKVNKKETFDGILLRGVITKSILRIYFSCDFGVYLKLGGGEIE